MDKRTFSIPTRKLELCETQQGIFCLGSEWVVHNYVLIVAFSIRCIRGKAGSPEQRLGVKPGSRRCRLDYRIDESSSRHAIAVAHQPLCSYENRIRRTRWRLCDRQSGRTTYKCAVKICPADHLTTLQLVH